MNELRPLLFVAMPFGKKSDPTARIEIDFDQIYQRAVRPAAEHAGLDVIRADEELEGGLIHVGMYERLLLSEFVVADLTSLNANVFYELGVRHAARPRTTVLMFATVTRLPFDAQPMRAVPYELVDGRLVEEEAQRLSEALAARLVRAREETETKDSPLFQLIRDYRGIELAHEVTESFRDRVREITAIRDRIDLIREAGGGIDELRQIAQSLEPFDVAPVELLVDLMLAYRSLSAWSDLVMFAERLPEPLRNHATIREQLALALGRRNQGDDRRRAVEILNEVERRSGPSAETSGILGGIYKRQFEEFVAAGDDRAAAASLDAGIAAYKAGLEADPRDAYPGINLLTLLLRRGAPGDQQTVAEVAPVVAFAVARRGAIGSGDYWDVATVLELAVIQADWSTAERALGRIALLRTEPWMLETTAENLEILGEALARHGTDTSGAFDIATDLRRKSGSG
jgi:hypothetical protein